MVIVAAVIVACAVLGGAVLVSDAIRKERQRGQESQHAEEMTRKRTAGLLATFAPAVGAAERDARAILEWDPLVRMARRLFPAEFVLLDQAAGGSFPFSREKLQAAHAQWSAEWLAWERAHDAEYRLKAAIASHDSQQAAASGGDPLARARADAVEQEKLDRYQRRYEEYTRVSRGLQALLPARG